MSKRCQLFNHDGNRRLRSLKREEGNRMFDDGLVYRLGENFALMKPKPREEGKRGVVQSRNPGRAKPIMPRRHLHKTGRGTLRRGGHGAGFESALMAVATESADKETIAAFSAWKPKARLAPMQADANTVKGRAILYFPCLNLRSNAGSCDEKRVEKT